MWKPPMAGRTVPCYNGSSKKTLCKRGKNNMSEATRYTIFFVLSFVTFTAWGMITHDLRGTVWYWAAGVLLAGLSEVWFRQVKKYPKRKRSRLAFSGSVR